MPFVRDLDILRSLAQRIPADARVHNNLGAVYYRRGLYAEAAGQLERALELDPGMKVAQRNLQIVYFATGYYDERVSCLRTRLELDAEDHEARRRLALMYLYGGDPTAAIDEWRKLLRALPGDAQAYQQIAHAEHELQCAFPHGSTDPAKSPEPTDSSEIEAQECLSLYAHSTARYEELVGESSMRPRVGDGRARTHFDFGVAFREKCRYDEAVREFRLAADHGEDPFLVLQARAEIVLLRGGGEDGAELYGQLTEREPASPKLCSELGVAQHQLGRLAEAEREYRRALELDNNYAPAWNNLAVVSHHRGAEADAEAAFRSCIGRARRPLAVVWQNLGLMLERVGRDAEAERTYRRALEVDPASAAAWTGLGILLLRKQRPEKARLALARGVEADPQLGEARYHLALALSVTGDYPAALRETRTALELRPYPTSSRFRLLIELQFEAVGVLAPALDPTDPFRDGGA